MPGYEVRDGREKDCVRIIYDLCSEGSARDTNGICRTTAEWETYCLAVRIKFTLIMYTYYFFIFSCAVQTDTRDLILRKVFANARYGRTCYVEFCVIGIA